MSRYITLGREGKGNKGLAADRPRSSYLCYIMYLPIYFFYFFFFEEPQTKTEIRFLYLPYLKTFSRDSEKMYITKNILWIKMLKKHSPSPNVF